MATTSKRRSAKSAKSDTSVNATTCTSRRSSSHHNFLTRTFTVLAPEVRHSRCRARQGPVQVKR